jgi:hypothetical protein
MSTTIKSAIKATEDAGTSISKDKLLDAIKKSGDKLFPFAKEVSGKFAVVRVPLC